jgi:DNA-binding MarR family transcriptional regulator
MLESVMTLKYREDAMKTGTMTPAHDAWTIAWGLAMENRSRLIVALSELGLTFPQAHAVRVLEEPLPMSDLAERLVCDASNVTGIADRLEARGFVERRAEEGDRRVKVLALTAAGHDVRERILEIVTEPPAAIAALPERDQRALRDILRRAVENRA